MSCNAQLNLIYFLTLYTYFHHTITIYFFVGLKNETKDLPPIADWFFNIDLHLACVCTMQHEVSHD